MPTSETLRCVLSGGVLVLCLAMIVAGQGKVTAASRNGAAVTQPKLPTVTQLDIAGLKKVLTPAGKPLLVNFWATWCDPCREEFPDLVKLDAEYKGKIDFITISLDDLAEIRRDVPKFLAEMNASMPAYLLKAQDDDAAIALISKDFTGALPFTILYDPTGKQAYLRQGKVNLETVKGEIDKLISPTATAVGGAVAIMDFVKIKDGRRGEALFFYENNWKVYREAAVKKGVIKSYELVEARPAPAGEFDLILITRYASDEQFKNSEKNFEPIIRDARPNGPLLKNELKPEAFRQNVFMRVVETVVPQN